MRAEISHVRHIITLHLLFTLVQGPDDGFTESETCSQGQQKSNISFVLTEDLSFSFIHKGTVHLTKLNLQNAKKIVAYGDNDALFCVRGSHKN